MDDPAHALRVFHAERRFGGKGALCVAPVVTQHARAAGLPRDAGGLPTEGGGQAPGLGRATVQAVLARHGIARAPAQEIETDPSLKIELRA